MKTFKTFKDAFEYCEQNGEFISDNLLYLEEHQDFEFGYVNYTLDEFALENGIDLEERKKEHIQSLTDEGRIEIEEFQNDN